MTRINGAVSAGVVGLIETKVSFCSATTQLYEEIQISATERVAGQNTIFTEIANAY